MSEYMDASNIIQIDAAVKELDKLEKKRAAREPLDVLEKDDYKWLKKFVRKHKLAYLNLEEEGREAYEIWARYLQGQRNMAGALEVGAVFKVLDRVLGPEISQDDYMRVFDRVQAIDGILVAHSKDKTERKAGADDEAGQF